MPQTDSVKREETRREKQGSPLGAKKKFNKIRSSALVNLLFTFLVPLVITILLEWVARGTLAGNKQMDGFFQALVRHAPSFIISYLLLVLLYVIISQASGLHALATALVGVVGIVPAVVTHFKLTMRGEPFLPWDISQIGDLMAVKEGVAFVIPVNIYITAGILVFLCVLAGFVKVPRQDERRKNIISRACTSGGALVLALVLLFGIFLNPAGSTLMGIKADMWMQDRYYRTNGVVTGFLTNLQMMKISKPAGYSAEAVQQLAVQAEQQANGPYYQNGYAAMEQNVPQQPDIIFVMAEAFWDVTLLPGVEYDQPVTENLTALNEEGAHGKLYSPSYGGGTCDVEFEALTGFSMEHLPSGSKPFQQYVTQEMFSLPNYLKNQGYDTLGIHGYGRRFWNRDKAYPRLGIDTFIAQDDFVNPYKRRGYISDRAMVKRIIEEHESRAEGDSPVFIHAVTMQNHGTYNRKNYPADELVKVTNAPSSVSDDVISQLEDCATGIREMDAALGRLTEYLRSTDRPTILVFWGDHMNPMGDGYGLFRNTGFIGQSGISIARMRETPLLIWSNYSTNEVELGTVAAYNLSPVMMDLYGLEKPVLFDYLIEQMDLMRARTRGVTVLPNGKYSYKMNEAQQRAFDGHAMLQYDFMFGQGVLEDYTSTE